MDRYIYLICCILFLLVPCLSPGEPRSLSESSHVRSSGTPGLDSLQTLSDYVLSHLPQTTPEELVHQKQIRNRFQRHGYPEVLYHVLNRDPLSALISYVKVIFYVQYSMPHKTFWIVAPNPRIGLEGIPFPDEWNFLPDPWKREWWYKE